MKKSRYTDSQIINILKQAEAGAPVPELCREHGMSSASFYKWRAKYGGMDASLMGRMKELEAENNRLKKMYADVQLQNDVIKEALAAHSDENGQRFRLKAATCSDPKRPLLPLVFLGGVIVAAEWFVDVTFLPFGQCWSDLFYRSWSFALIAHRGRSCVRYG